MAKDGTNRGGRRVRAGDKPMSAAEKIQKGQTVRVMENNLPVLTPTELDAVDLPEGAVIEGADMPKPSDYLSARQKNGVPLGTDEIYKETWLWLKERGCEKLVSTQLVRNYAMSVSRWIQCEHAISEYGFLAKHPTTGQAIASPYVSMSQNYMKQVNNLWYQIFQIVKENCSADFSGATPQDDVIWLMMQASMFSTQIQRLEFQKSICRRRLLSFRNLYLEKAKPCTWQNLETTLAISAVQSDICTTNIKEENKMKFPSKDIVEKVRAEYPIGTRVELVKMDDVQAPPVGTKGTVKGVDDTASLLVDWDNGCVPVVIWEVTPSDEKALDRYEGYPAFYYKKDIKLQYKGIRTGKRRTINAFAYIMHEDRPIGVPSIYYMKTCLDGYDTFYFDKQILLNAYKNSMEMCENEK